MLAIVSRDVSRTITSPERIYPSPQPIEEILAEQSHNHNLALTVMVLDRKQHSSEQKPLNSSYNTNNSFKKDSSFNSKKK